MTVPPFLFSWGFRVSGQILASLILIWELHAHPPSGPNVTVSPIEHLKDMGGDEKRRYMNPNRLLPFIDNPLAAGFDMTGFSESKAASWKKVNSRDKAQPTLLQLTAVIYLDDV